MPTQNEITPEIEITADSAAEIAAKIAAEIAAQAKALPNATVAQLRAVRREFTRRIASLSPRVVHRLALELIGAGVTRFLAYELLLHHRAALAAVNARLLGQLARGMAAWVDVDCFSSYVAGPAWRAHQVPDALIHRWARSKDRWFRRAALVATVPLNNQARGGSGDAARTLAVCSLAIDDRDDMVVKALSWALRELSKRDARAVGGFVRAHADRLAPRVLREVRTKLVTGKKSVPRAVAGRRAKPR